MDPSTIASVTAQDVHTFGPFAVVAVAYVLGLALKRWQGYPDWLIAPTSAFLGLVSGAGAAAALGQDWRGWLLTSLLGMVSGMGGSGLHETGKNLKLGMTRPKGPDSGAGASPESKGPPPLPPSSLPRLAWASCLMLAAGCTPTQAAQVKTISDGATAACIALVPPPYGFLCTLSDAVLNAIIANTEVKARTAKLSADEVSLAQAAKTVLAARKRGAK